MKGDFSRILFDPAKHYAGVLHQQGRVWLDSDWNEDVLERLESGQVEMRDIVGPTGVPSPGSGFVLSASGNAAAPDDFKISAGHCYVDGILCRLDAATSYHTQPDFLDAPTIAMPTTGTLTAVVYLEVWRRLITYLEDPSIREVALGGPDTSARLKTVVQIKTVVWPNAPLNPTCAQAAALIPTPGQGVLTTVQPTAQAQTPCQLPDPSNYTGRENRLYRVQIHNGGDAGGAGSSFQIALAADVAAGATLLTLATALSAAQADAALRSGFVTVSDISGASEKLPLASATGAAIQLASPLQQAHTKANSATVSGGVAQFKWSRDNAAFATGVTNVAADRVTLTLASLGRDAATSLKQGDLVEICDDASELGPARGHLTYLNSIPDADTFAVALLDPLPAAFVLNGGQSSRNLVLRRWDGADSTNSGGTSNDLGDGVQIQFGGSFLQPGDYWQFAARSADGSVQPLLNAPPAGIRRSRTSLAIITWGPPAPSTPPSTPPAGMAMTVIDCRTVFPSLSGFPQTDKVTRITGVTLVPPAGGGPASALVNDTNVLATSFGGIDIQCEAAIDPASISRPTCFLTIEYPVDFSNGQVAGLVTAYLVAKLVGTVSTANGVISWRPLAQTQLMLSQMATNNPSERGILTRLVLKGNFIWSQNDPTSFLDGEVFGSHQSGTSNLALALPSGDKRRGGDFETWFWVVAAPSFATGITPNPAQIYAGAQQTFTVTFNNPAPTAGVMTVTSSATNIAVVVPASVQVAAGASSATFTATPPAAGVPQTTGATNISASYGGPTVSAILIVAPPPVLTGQLQLNVTAVVVGGTATGTVTLNGPAPASPAAGVTVNISTSNAGVASVPGTVLISPNQTSITFSIKGVAVGSATIAAVATSSAGPTGPTLSALITVVKEKEKDTKETKETKDTKETKERKDAKESTAERKVGSVEHLQPKPFEGAKIADSATPLNVSLPSGVASQSGVLARAFIRPEERPAVEKTVLNDTGIQ